MIEKLFNKAYTHKENKGHNFIYIAVDMHGTVFNEFKRDKHSGIYGKAIFALSLLNKRPDIVLVGFTSSFKRDIKEMQKLLETQGINFTYFNENPECKNTVTGDFNKKFYYDVLLDDRAGFDPEIHWDEIIKYYGGK